MSKHPDPAHAPVKGQDDLERNPGIGQSMGLKRGEGLGEIEGENTVEGDVANNAGRHGEAVMDRGHDHVKKH